MFERPSQRMRAAVGTDPSCIAQESPLLMCSLSLSLSKHIFFKIQSRLVIYIASGQRHLFHLPLSCILFKNDHNESIQLFGCERVRGTFLASDMRKTMQAIACLAEVSKFCSKKTNTNTKICSKKQAQTQSFTGHRLPNRSFKFCSKIQAQTQNNISKNKHKHTILFQKTNTNTKFHGTSLAQQKCPLKLL